MNEILGIQLETFCRENFWLKEIWVFGYRNDFGYFHTQEFVRYEGLWDQKSSWSDARGWNPAYPEKLEQERTSYIERNLKWETLHEKK